MNFRIWKTSITGTVVLGLLCALLLSGCIGASHQESRLVWSGTTGPNEMAYQYAVFTGTVDGRASGKEGQTLVLEYGATVKEGTLSFGVQTPGRITLWEITLDGSTDEQQKAQLDLAEAGTYTIYVTGNQTAGDFAVAWSVR